MERTRRRRALRLACWNAGCWALGNGLVGSSLVVFLALDYGAVGVGISLILAAPRFVGVLRVAAPSLLERFGSHRRFCIGSYALSAAVLAALPIVSAPGVLPGRTSSLLALIALWAIYHLFEFFGTVALWSWIGDLAPRRIRGRFFGHRERWLDAGRLAGMVCGGVLTFYWSKTHSPEDKWHGYAICAFAGAVAMLVAIMPLAAMFEPRVARRASNASRVEWSDLARQFGDRPFRRLLAYGCWLAFFNGVTQSAQFVYTKNVLAIEYFELLGLRALLRAGQSGIGPTTGAVIDRFGCRRVMAISQLIVATGLIFFLVATPSAKGWVVGAFVVWIGYAGLNIGLPKLMLDLAPGEKYSPSVATFYAVTEFCHGTSVVLGGLLLDALAGVSWNVGRWQIDRFALLFVAGWATRSLGVLLIARLAERR